MSKVRRIYVRKKQDFCVLESALLKEATDFLRIKGITGIQIFIRYDVENVPENVFSKAVSGLFAEPPVDDIFFDTVDTLISDGDIVFSVEALPGQFDQRADSAIQALGFIDENVKAIVRTATTYIISGRLTEEETARLQSYLCNPVDSRLTDETLPETLLLAYDEPADVKIFDGFCTLSDTALKELYESLSLAMTFADFLWIRDEFLNHENRDPSMTEIRVLDTYWSDHCRHTTFSTEITDVSFEESRLNEPVKKAYQEYLNTRTFIYNTEEKQKEKYISLMDVALAAMKDLKKKGFLTDLEESEENNACTITCPVTIVSEEKESQEEWLIFFKNETHNHPTEIEPFGGAATCLGGAIRDPLSGRGYVYQAMRVTGAADPTRDMAKTLPGKLPQKKIVQDAAKGYSSYGNQIGLATGLVDEIYHPGYVAKRMEIGAVMGAAPRKNVKRLSPEKGDTIILLGGRTGRDGIGGATGSSKSHTAQSLTECGAEVQKGNAPTERKIQHLFKRHEVTRLIKKCNDFGAGGVSVAIGELAEGLDINLDLVPKKYEGLDGTELAISESQERMAVVTSPEDEALFLKYAAEENLEATRVAVVTDSGRLRMTWRGKTIVDISRAFLDTNGARQETKVLIKAPAEDAPLLDMPNATVKKAADAGDYRTAWLELLRDLNVCSKKGLSEMFDASIGAATVLMPYGGKNQMTPIQAMAAHLPVTKNETNTTTFMSYGFDPVLSSKSPFHGAACAVLQSVAKLAASGCDLDNVHFTFQEYFGHMREEPVRWGQPLAALLGAYAAQMALKKAAIGGKDSMSGTFGDIDVPPTLVSFAVGVDEDGHVVTPELKKEGSALVVFETERDEYELPVYEDALRMYKDVLSMMRTGTVISCYALDAYGTAAALAKMSFGNGLGVRIEDSVNPRELFSNGICNLLAEVEAERQVEALRMKGAHRIGTVTNDMRISCRNAEILLPEALQCWTSRLEKVFPEKAQGSAEKVKYEAAPQKSVYVCKHKVARPRVFIPVFPGTNCEYDLTRAFEKVGAEVSVGIFKNLNTADISDSVAFFEKEIMGAQILMFPGGFSAGDEPDGSAKFFATAFQSERLREATMRLLNERDGLCLGICNGFQAMVKLGLLPDGKITGQTQESPTLTYNTIGRHISHMAYIKVINTNSPWLNLAKKDEVYVTAVSHGEGRFVASKDVMNRLFANGQVATLYSDCEGLVSMDPTWNLNGSYMAVEGITSPDGRCYGKMAHNERSVKGTFKNIVGNKDMHLFEAGVKYFK